MKKNRRAGSTALNVVALLVATGIGSATGAAQAPGADIEKGFSAYQAGNYSEALKTVEPLAQARNSRAQHMLGTMYEKGQGVVKSYVQAYYWYSLAASTGEAAYVKSLDALSARMTPKEIAAAQKQADAKQPKAGTEQGFLGTIKVGSGACSAFGEKMVEQMAYTFRAGATADQMVYDIVYYSGLKPNFDVRAAPNVPNAAAIIQGVQRYILYNPEFMRNVEASTGTDWAAYSIMAHEIGHHLQGHTLDTTQGSRPPLELEADEFSGFIMARMNGTLQEAQTAMSRFGSDVATPTHPGKTQRLEAIRTGWERGMSTRDKAPLPPTAANRRIPTERPGGGEAPVQAPNPQTRMTNACVTPMGACYMMMQVPVGMSCWCNFGWYGSYAGIAQ